MLHESEQQQNTVISIEEQPSDLCSNNAGLGCSSVDVTTQISVAEQALLQELAEVFMISVELGFNYEGSEERCNLLQGINERTS